MRPLAVLLLVAALTPAQDGAWTVARPASEPSGDTLKLAWALEPGWAHSLELAAISEATSSVLGATKVEVGLAYSVNVLRRDEEDGSFEYEMPLRVTKLEVNGEDGLPGVADLLDGANVTGKLDPRGNPVKGSLQAPGLGPLGPQVGDWLGNVFPRLPPEPVRKGEVWESEPDDYAARLGAGEEDEARGAIYHKLVDVIRLDGAEVAVIETVFAITLDAESVRVQGASGKGRVRVRGKTVLHVGRDGYLRRSVTTIENEIALDGAPRLEVRSTGEIELTGRRTRIRDETTDDR